MDHNSENRKIITDETIINLKPLMFKTIEEEEITEFVHFQCQRVLALAQEKNDSNEVACAINLDTFDVLNPVFGDEKSVDIDYLVDQMRGTNYAFLVVHNHPSGLHFSRRDLKTFIDADNVTILVVLGNDGSVYVIEKTRQLSLYEILSSRKTLLDYKNGIICFSDVIAQIKAFGIVYNEL